MHHAGVSQEGFPRQWARTRRFSLGIPRSFAISNDGMRVAYLRSRSGNDPSTCLWLLDVSSGQEQLLVDPDALDGTGDVLPPEERARRERSRELSGGIVRFAADRALRRLVFDHFGQVFIVDTAQGGMRTVPVHGAAVDPRLDPLGTRIAYVSNGALHVVGADGAAGRALAEPEGDCITYGLAEFVAAEEMGRQEGYWWAPDGTRLAVARVDVSPVQRWYISDPATPDAPPLEVRYPVAGTRNADVTLHLIDTDGARLPVRWDTARFEYLVSVDWTEHGLLVVVQSRDQRTMRVLDVDLETGATTVIREDTDDAWVDIVSGLPARLEDGTLVWSADLGGAKRLLVDGEPVTPTDVQVRGVLDVDGDAVVFSASIEPTEIGVWTWTRRGGVARFSPDGTVSGVQTARRCGGTTVLVSRTLDDPAVQVSVHREGREVAKIASLAETPAVSPNLTLCALGPRELRAAVQFPSAHSPGDGKLPVLLDPYGGPGHQRVVAAAGAYLESQWFAEQGFVVLAIDGRGTPGRGPEWDRSIHGDVATPVLEDQVDGLLAAAERWADIDLERVAIRGWSFGGYLAALAVLRRPDIVHVAVAGAPVTDDRLYDTHYTERYLGRPDEEPENYDRVSLLRDAARLQRPLMLIHGLSDDNVVVANTLRLSAALVAAGRPHTVLPLPGLTHSANSEAVTENLLLLELDFIRGGLGG